jgi:hypothetical protein
MLKFVVALIALCAATAAQAAPPAHAPILPTLADCVRADTVVCTFRLIREADLADRGAVLNAPAGLPKIDHVELRRIDDELLLLVEYFVPDASLQGVAL